MEDGRTRWRRTTGPVPVVWPALTLAAWGLARLLGAPEGLADSAVIVGVLLLGARVHEAGRRWRERRRRTARR